MSTPTRTLRIAIGAVAAVAVVSAALGIGVRSTFGAHVAVDETQYILTALSLAEDFDLDLKDELAAQRWRSFADVEPPAQTEVLDDSRQISPHDPLLPALLALPMGWGGWVAAKITLAALAGVVAGLTLWLAVRRFSVPLPLATIGVGIAAASAPLAVYGQQVYPELPAALAVLLGCAALTGSPSRGNLVLLAAAVTALPWLSAKYTPVAAVLAGIGLVLWWRSGSRRAAVALVGGLAVMAAGYLAVHRAVWGGLTAYSSGDHFKATGEFSVVGVDPNYAGRALRLVGLLVDRDFGIAAWQPAWLLLVPAVGFLLVRRARNTAVLLAPLIAGWLVATFVALTMHGYWWPGRQVVVVLPVAVIAIVCWLANSSRVVRAIAALLGLAGVITHAWLLVDGYAERITWVSGFAQTGAPTHQVLRPLLPDYRGDFLAGHVAWSAALLLIATAAAVGGWAMWDRRCLGGIDPPAPRVVEQWITERRITWERRFDRVREVRAEVPTHEQQGDKT